METNKKFNIYIIILSNISTAAGDFEFGKIVREKRYDWWRRSPFNWILITPISTTKKEIVDHLLKTYGSKDFFCVLQVDIIDYVGLIPMNYIENLPNPMSFFEAYKRPDYVPAWEREEPFLHFDDNPKNN